MDMGEGAAPNILIIDDDVGLLRLLERVLKREGFQTTTASSGQEALAWASRKTADLMLLDLKLQDMEGRDLIHHLASAGRSLPFIIITGQGDERVAVEMIKCGALDYLVKDVQFTELLPTVVGKALEHLEKDKRLAATLAALEQSRNEVLAISEREQTRFGAELHDGLGQELTAIELMCEAVRSDLHSNPGLKQQMDRVCRSLREAIAHTRSLARSLSPVHLGSSGLAEALAELAARTSELGRLKCAFRCPSPVVIDDNLVAGHFFRIAQEAVNNAVKHAQAKTIIIRLRTNDAGLLLEISDDGKGMPATPNPDRGMGLQVMKHRAGVIGAQLEVRSQSGKGVTVTCALPVQKG